MLCDYVESNGVICDCFFHKMRAVKKIFFVSMCCFGLLKAPAQSPVKNQQAPNIILFLVDDMGWMDGSQPFGDSICPLNKRYHTPNMQRLAREGMLFSNAYAHNVCTPTRAALLTGASPARTHITNWTSPFRNTPSDYPDSLLQAPAWNANGISTDTTENAFYIKNPLPSILRSAGYTTLHVGKAHWGSLGTPASNPLNLGFMVNVAGSQAGHPQSFYGQQNFGNQNNKTTVNAIADLYDYYGQDIFLTEALTLKAKQLMETPIKRKQPFFLYFGQYAVHLPIQPDKRFVQKYYDAGLDSVEAAYASMVEGMDKSLGDLMDFMKQKSIDKNTIIIFMSDNGGLSDHGRGGGYNIHNLPLRAGKGSLYEGGIRVPLMVKWPGVTKPGSRTAQYVIAEDAFPSVLEMAGLNNADRNTVRDGLSYVPILKNGSKAAQTRPLIFHYPNRWTDTEREAISWASAIRQGDWKLVYLMKQQKLELYNLKSDIGELQDVSALHPEKTAALAKLLAHTLRQRNAQMPVWKATGKQVAWPDELNK